MRAATSRSTSSPPPWPTAVVDLLEVVDVDVHEGNRIRLAPRAGDLLQQAAVDVAAVVDAGQRIGQADVLEHLVADHVFQADRDDRRHVLDEVGAQQRA
jgi:pyruvate/2-oxoglutarate dehydrogenase complex dihydrolipoamide acyltransferase (E2) component